MEFEGMDGFSLPKPIITHAWHTMTEFQHNSNERRYFLGK